MPINRRQLLTTAAHLTVAATAAQSTHTRAATNLPIIDIHTHMFSPGWMDIARASEDPDFYLGSGDQDGALIYRGASMGTIVPAMLDYDMRLQAMDEAGVDIAVISLTAPNVYWGSKQQSVAAARAINDDFAQAARDYSGRIYWLASLPWQYPEEAISELKRAKNNGAVGVCMLTNVLGAALTEPQFARIWREIEAMAMPVFIHPTKPYVDYIGDEPFGLFNSIGFTTDTTLCFARMIHEGFFDTFPGLRLIASHGGGTLPYLIARMDRMWDKAIPGEVKTAQPPSAYMQNIYFDALVFDDDTLDFLIRQVGHERVLYGSDYPFMIADMTGVKERVNQRPARQRDAILHHNAAGLFTI